MQNKNITIIVADDDKSIRTVLKQALLRENYNIELAGNAGELWGFVSQGKGDLIITDVSMPDMNVFDIIPKIKRACPNLPIIVISALTTFSTALQAEKENVFEYIPKPFDLTVLLTTIQNALLLSKKIKKETTFEETFPLIGKSSAMQNIYRMIARLANTELSVIISGESGTGKKVVAKALHDYGQKSEHPFISLNMTSLDESEIEQKLFNKADSKLNSSGLLASLESTTLFINDLDEMPLSIQKRFLGYFDTTDINNSENQETNLPRIIAATSQNLPKLVQEQKFRKDLYHRLNIVSFHIPALRDRTEDIPLLIEYFLKEIKSSTLFSDKSIQILKDYHWPGNVRELQNLVIRLSYLYPNQTINETTISQNLQNQHQQKPILKTSLSSMIENHIRRYFDENKGLPINNLYDQMISEIEKPLIQHTLAETDGNQIKAAAILGINRNTLRKKINIYNIICKHK